jgi:hypothetical protein
VKRRCKESPQINMNTEEAERRKKQEEALTGPDASKQERRKKKKEKENKQGRRRSMKGRTGTRELQQGKNLRQEEKHPTTRSTKPLSDSAMV